jgi:3-methyladenine DNA glycosylase AlkD
LDQKKKIVDCYLEHLDGVNNRDLVDSSADKILGAYLFETNTPYPLLETLAHSSDRYRRRVAMIATFFRIKQGKTDVPLCLARLLLKDTHSLMHKAVGRMLRELGKRCDRQILKDFLDEMAPVMPRTALRYAIEHFSPDERKRYLSLKYSIQ